MPLIHLTDDELRDIARACLAYQEQKRAEEMQNPVMRRTFAELSRHYGMLATKLQKAREPD